MESTTGCVSSIDCCELNKYFPGKSANTFSSVRQYKNKKRLEEDKCKSVLSTGVRIKQEPDECDILSSVKEHQSMTNNNVKEELATDSSSNDSAYTKKTTFPSDLFVTSEHFTKHMLYQNIHITDSVLINDDERECVVRKVMNNDNRGHSTVIQSEQFIFHYDEESMGMNVDQLVKEDEDHLLRDNCEEKIIIDKPTFQWDDVSENPHQSPGPEANELFNDFECKREEIEINDRSISEDENQHPTANTCEGQNTENVHSTTNEFENFKYSLFYDPCHNDVSFMDMSPTKYTVSNFCRAKLTVRSDLVENTKPHKVLPRSKLNDTSYKKSPKSKYHTKPKKQHQNLKCTKPFKCKVCKKCFTSKIDLIEHLKTHPNRKSNLCVFCGETFKTQSQLKEHLFHHTGIPLFTCSKCEEQFESAVDLKRHLKESHDKTYKCRLCSKQYTTKGTLRHHMINHNDKGYKCNQCGKKFPTKSFLNRHMVTHSDNRPYSCEQCEKSFKTTQALRQHLLKTHINPTRYTCTVCGKDFADPSNLKRHQDLHSSDKKYCCAECDQSFFQKQSLLNHFAKYHPHLTDARPQKPNPVKRIQKKVQCEICFKMIAKSIFHHHLNTHLGIKPYQCEICHKCFTTPNSIYSHSLVHIEKQLSCDICGMEFRYNNSLRLHTRLHTGEKPYQCEICQKTFRNISNCKRHQKVHYIPDEI